MPVNYKPVPDVQPERAPTPKVHEDFPHVQLSRGVGEALDHLGGAYGVLGGATREVGAALDGLGKQTEGAGNKIWETAIALKQLESDKKVDDLVMAYNLKQTDLGVKFRAAEGTNAGPDALTAHIKESMDLRKGMRNGLTEYEQRKFDGETRGIFNQEASRSVTHSAQQIHHSVIATNSNKISMLQEQVSRATTQDQLDDAHKDLGDALVKQSHLEGWTPEQAEFNTRKAVSKATSMWISNRSDEEPTKAMAILEQAYKAGNITEEDYDRLHREVKAKVEDYTARNAADIARRNPNAPWAEKEKIAREEAAKLSNDPRAIDKAVQRAWADHQDNERQKLSQERQDNNTLDAFSHGRRSPDGKLPTRIEEVNVFPDVKAAYERLTNERDRDAFERQLQKNSLEDYAETPEEVEKFRRIRQKSFDPENYEWFRNLTLRNLQDLHLSRSHRNQLLDRKDEIEKQGIRAMENPHVKRAEGILKAEGLIPDAIKNDVDQMNRLRGVLHDEIDLQQKLQKRELTPEEIRNMGLQILATDPNSGFHGWFTKPMFQTMSEATKKLVEDYKKIHSGMSDDEAMKAVAKAQYDVMFEKYYGGKKTTPAGAGPAAPQSQ